jgi:hypothetical protein
MSSNTSSCLVTLLCVFGFVAVAVLLLAISIRSAVKGLRGFSALVAAKKRNWDEFVSRTGLQWELKLPGSNPAAASPIAGDLSNLTGRVIGTYRGYPVALDNLTRDQHRGSNLMVTGERYYTEFRLTIRNPAGIKLTIRKDKQLTVEPQDLGNRLIGAVLSFGRLAQGPVLFGIEIEQQQMAYVQAGMEQDSNRLYDALESLCDLADAVAAFQPAAA